jgi:hypothetical protein
MIRLVCSFRLWDDETALDQSLADKAWGELESRMGQAGGGSLWELQELTDAALHELAPAPKALFGQARGMRHWKMSEDGLRQSGFPKNTKKGAWSLHINRSGVRHPIPVQVTSFGLWASGEGIGYSTVDLQLRHGEATSAPSLDDFLNVLHFARFLRKGGSTLEAVAYVDPAYSSEAPKPLGIGGLSVGSEWRAGDDPGHYHATLPLKELLCALYRQLTGRDADSMDRAVLENREALRAFVMVDLPTLGHDAHAGEHELLLQIAEMAPSSREIGRTLEPHSRGTGLAHYEYSQGAHFLFSQECTAFVAIGQPRKPFWTETMPHHVLNEYFTIQIMTMYQRHLVDEVRRLAARGGSKADSRSEESHDRLWDQIQVRAIDAKARGYFLEVSVRTNHGRFESTLREILHVDRAYELAMGLVDALCETQIARVEMRREREARRRDRFWQFVASIVLLPTFVLTFLNVNMPGITTDGEGLAFTQVFLLALAAAVLGWVGAEIARMRRIGAQQNGAPEDQSRGG